jgi:hypothetical protein
MLWGRQIWRGNSAQVDKLVTIVIRIHDPCEIKLLEIAQATGCSCPFFGPGKSGQQHRRENGNDRNHHQQFNQREGASRTESGISGQPGFSSGLSPNRPVEKALGLHNTKHSNIFYYHQFHFLIL